MFLVFVCVPKRIINMNFVLLRERESEISINNIYSKSNLDVLEGSCSLSSIKFQGQRNIPAPFVSTSFSLGSKITGNFFTFPSSATITGSGP